MLFPRACFLANWATVDPLDQLKRQAQDNDIGAILINYYICHKILSLNTAYSITQLNRNTICNDWD